MAAEIYTISSAFTNEPIAYMCFHRDGCVTLNTEDAQDPPFMAHVNSKNFRQTLLSHLGILAYRCGHPASGSINVFFGEGDEEVVQSLDNIAALVGKIAPIKLF